MNIQNYNFLIYLKRKISIITRDEQSLKKEKGREKERMYYWNI